VAEREVAIGVSPSGCGPAALASGVASPEPGQIEITKAVHILVSRIGEVASSVRSRLKPLGELDLGSQDLLIGVGRTLEHQLWMLRAQLPNGNTTPADHTDAGVAAWSSDGEETAR